MRALQLNLLDEPCRALVDDLLAFRDFGRGTQAFVEAGIPYFVNQYWTSAQRRSHSLHEISYRACFKAELPRFFIDRLAAPGELVFDPFMGRGTTLLEAALRGRRIAGADVNPLSVLLIRPRLHPISLGEVQRRLGEIDWRAAVPEEASELTVFFHPDTLVEIAALRSWLLERDGRGRLDAADDWIRMVALSRLTGHSAGFFSAYTLPPNQAVGIAAQRKINADRNQVPPRREVAEIILKKTRTLLRSGAAPPAAIERLATAPAWSAGLRPGSVALVVTSPPFLDVVDYRQDNWLRCWFAGIDPERVAIDQHRTAAQWERFVRRAFAAFVEAVRPGGHIAFEVGEVRGGEVLLERHVVAATAGLPLTLLGVMVNDQRFTKTANCWGVTNNRRGTNTNRIVVFTRD
jgi:DNA methylase